MVEGIPYMILTFVGAVVLAYACLKLYDEPVAQVVDRPFSEREKEIVPHSYGYKKISRCIILCSGRFSF